MNQQHEARSASFRLNVQSTQTESQLPRTAGLSVQAAWLIVARTLGFAFTLAMPIILVRVFSPHQFGTYKLAFVAVASCVALLPFSFGVSAFYFLPRAPEIRKEVICNIVLYYASAGTIALLILLVWPGILRLVFGNDRLASLAAPLGFIILTWVFSSFLEMIATATADVLYSTLFIISAQLTKAVLLISAALYFRTVEAVLYAAVVQGVLQSVLLLWYLNRRFPHFWRHFDSAVAREQMSYVIPMGISGVLYTIQLDLHNYLVANAFTTTQYAIYAVGTAQLPLVGILWDSVNSVLLARVSKLQHDDQPEQILDLMLRSWRKLAAVFLPMFAGLMVLGPDFIRILYTDQYLASWPIFAVNLTLLFTNIFITDSVIRAYASYRVWYLKFRGVLVVAQVILSLACIRLFGITGALIGTILAFGIERFVSVRLVFQILNMRRSEAGRLNYLFWFSLASAIAAAAAAAVRFMMAAQGPAMRLAVCGLVFGIVYTVAVLTLNLLESDERDMLQRYAYRLTGARL